MLVSQENNLAPTKTTFLSHNKYIVCSYPNSLTAQNFNLRHWRFFKIGIYSFKSIINFKIVRRFWTVLEKVFIHKADAFSIFFL